MKHGPFKRSNGLLFFSSAQLVMAGFGLMLLSGCSTPKPPEQAEGSAYERAVSSYELCRSRLYPADRGTSCDMARPASQASYGEYSRSYQTWDRNVYGKAGSEMSLFGGGAASGSPELSEYLNTLSDAELESLISQWSSLSDQY